MTAQVAVLNLTGIAVASDTYVTTFVNGEAKSMGNSQKIYELGPQHKVLILHSNTISINQIPHWVHVSEWAKTLSLPLPTLQAYVDSYRTWTASEKRMLNVEAEQSLLNSLLNEHYYGIAADLDSTIEGITYEDGATDKKKKAQLQKALNDAINSAAEQLDELENYSGLSEKAVAKALDDHGFKTDEKVKYIFERFSLSDAAIAQLVSLASQILLKVQTMRQDSDLAFVGFGEEEPFGGVIRLNCRGIYAGTLVANAQERYKVAPYENNSGISYFAQRDAMWGFVSGYNPDIMEEVKNLIWRKVEEKWGATTDEAIGWNLAQEIEQEIEAFSNKKFISPMLSTIEAMGMNSLAALAESLVGLQATATYSKAGAATVGGLIEVVTIDRKHGIRWKTRLEKDGND